MATREEINAAATAIKFCSSFAPEALAEAALAAAEAERRPLAELTAVSPSPGFDQEYRFLSDCHGLPYSLAEWQRHVDQLSGDLSDAHRRLAHAKAYGYCIAQRYGDIPGDVERASGDTFWRSYENGRYVAFEEIRAWLDERVATFAKRETEAEV